MRCVYYPCAIKSRKECGIKPSQLMNNWRTWSTVYVHNRHSKYRVREHYQEAIVQEAIIHHASPPEDRYE
jgi:hypothetical protein